MLADFTCGDSSSPVQGQSIDASNGFDDERHVSRPLRWHDDAPPSGPDAGQSAAAGAVPVRFLRWVQLDGPIWHALNGPCLPVNESTRCPNVQQQLSHDDDYRPGWPTSGEFLSCQKWIHLNRLF